MARRYQQGIGVPETLGVQPTMWQEPKAPSIQRWQWNSPNAGVSRNYGSTPGYVDTMPHRWNYGPRNLQRTLQNFTRLGGEPDTTLPPPTGPAQGIGAPPMGPAQGMGAPPMGPAGMPSAPSATASRRTPGVPFETPPPHFPLPLAPPATASDVAESGMGAGGFLPGTPREEIERTEFFEKIRKASDEPLSSPVEWRDDPEMDKLSLPGKGSEEALLGMLEDTSRPQITSSPKSRTQNRKRKA